MNRKKHNYTLLLAIMLTLGLALPMGIEGVFAKNTDQTEQITESAAKSVEIAENAEESSGQFFYEQLMDCSSLNDLEVLLYDEKNSAALDALNEEELNRLLVRVDEIFTAIAEPTEADTILKEKLLKKLSEYADVTSRTNDKSGETGSPAETKKKKAAAKAAVRDEYIYFDLAAGDVNIGKETYTGHVYVGGTPKPVTGRHLETNKYYVYQSTATNKDNTGYAKQEDFNGKINCRVPEYDRVKIKVDGEEKLWKDYITNNTDVKKVSQDWETAAVKDGRTALGGAGRLQSISDGKPYYFCQ